MAIKLVAIDLDDTLLNSSLQIAQPCREAIRQVQDLGIMVTLATGRSIARLCLMPNRSKPTCR